MAIQNALDNYKTEQQSVIDQKKKTAQQQAQVNHKKLLKYLPQQTKGQSVGMTESAAIAATNSLVQQLGTAEANHKAETAELNNYVRQEQERLDDKAYERRWNEDEREYNRGQDEEKKITAAQDKAFADAQGVIDSGTLGEAGDVLAYIESIKDSVSVEQYQTLVQLAGNASSKLQSDKDDADAADKEEKQNAMFDDAKNVIESGTLGTKQEVLAYIESIKDSIRPEQYQNLTALAANTFSGLQSDKDDADAADEKTRQDEIFDNAWYIIENGVWNTSDELMNYVKGIEVDVRPEQYNALMQYASSIANDPDQKAADEAYNEEASPTVKTSHKAQLGGWLTDTAAGNDFTIGGYEVELGTKVSSSVVPSDMVTNVADRQPFTYNGDLFIKIGNNVYSVRDRDGGYSSDGYKGALALLESGSTPQGDTNGESTTTMSSTSGEVFGPSAPQGNTTTSVPKREVKRQGNYIYYSDGTKKRYK